MKNTKNIDGVNGNLIYICKNINNMEEIWKDVIGYEGQYRVSNKGRIISFKKGFNYLKPEIFLKGRYCRITLSNNGISERFMIHRLVAEHFIEKIEGRNIVNHKDSNGLNNCVDNLEWVTHRENISYSKLTKYTGVSFEKRGNYIRYRSSVMIDGKKIRSSHKTEEEAYNEYIRVLKENNIFNKYSHR